MLEKAYTATLFVIWLLFFMVSPAAFAQSGPTHENLSILLRSRADEIALAYDFQPVNAYWHHRWVAEAEVAGWEWLESIKPPPASAQRRVRSHPNIIPTTEIQQAIVAAFPEDPQTALRVAKCESGWTVNIISPTNDYGMFQINKSAHEDHLVAALGYTMDDMLQLGPNLAVARSLYNGGGWGAWYMSKKCWG